MKKLLAFLLALVMLTSLMGGVNATTKIDEWSCCCICEGCFESGDVKFHMSTVFREDEFGHIQLCASITNKSLDDMVKNGEIPLDTKYLIVRSNYGCEKRDREIGWILLDDITPLKKLTKLEALLLTNSSVSDLKPLSELTNLKTLDLGYTKVTDLTPLKPLKKLENICVTGTKVGLRQINQLKSAIPGLRVWSDNPASFLSIFDVIEVLKYVMGMPSVFDCKGNSAYLVLALGTSEPDIFDALEILKILSE